jgi:excisionase family DNA binding protein
LKPRVQRLHSNGKEKNLGGIPREFYTVRQLAELLQLNEMTIYRMVGRGELPCYLIGRTKRFRRSDVDEFLESCRLKRRKVVKASS